MNNRKTIGVLLELEWRFHFESYFSSLKQIISTQLKKYNYDAVFYNGAAISKSHFYRDARQRNFIYSFIDKKRIDGLIIISVLLSHGEDQDSREFLDSLAGIPSVFIGTAPGDFPYVSFDNYHAMYAMTEHLVKVHGYKNFSFITGPSQNLESSERLKACRDCLGANQLELKEENVFEGDFLTTSGEEFARFLLSRSTQMPDVIVSASDLMALGAANELEKKGIKIPDDIAISGFDNIPEASFFKPGLTTVYQPLEAIGKVSVDMMAALLEKRRTDSRGIIKYLKPRLIIRESCGCQKDITLENNSLEMSRNLTDIYEMSGGNINKIASSLLETKAVFSKNGLNIKLLNQYLEHFLRTSGLDADQNGAIRRAVYQEAQERISLEEWKRERRDTLLEEFFREIDGTQDQAELFKALEENLNAFGISFMTTVMYQNQENNPTATVNGNIIHIAGVQSDLVDKYNGHNFPCIEILPDELLNTQNHLVIVPLFFHNEQIGYSVFSDDAEETFYYENIRMYLSNSIHRIIQLARKQETEKKLENALNELQEKNIILTEISNTDELTGLYNRRGFFIAAKNMIELCRRKNIPVLIISTDMDNLKNINDSLGHQKGDEALQAFASVLMEIFRESDILGRIGGDEFLIISGGSELQSFTPIFSRIKGMLDDINESSSGFTVSSSFGAVELKENETLNDAIRRADMEMYIQKKSKKRKS